MNQAPPKVNAMGIPDYINQLGITRAQAIAYNPSYEQLFHDELNTELSGYERGQLTNLGAVNVDTGKYTGRSPKDKYIVADEVSKQHIWWRSEHSKNDNKPISPDVWQELKALALEELSGKPLYVVDAFCGANPDTRLSVRFIVEVAWQAHFVKNMFIRPSTAELENFNPDFVVINASKCSNPNWRRQGLNSETFVAFNLTEKMQIIGGTWYGGEMKKGMFSMMNYYLPLQEIACMHSAANVGKDGDVAIFFGLSGTGKTTLSADPKRALIGDDEHGWDSDGVFNLEGGCYAKTIDLDPEKEPDIYGAIRRNALLENLSVDASGNIDFSDGSKTENTRVSYPIDHIENIVKPISKAGHASTVIFLTADAFGVLPPVAKLTAEQAQYYYLSGYTSKMAGTEIGINEPTPTFSACFGQAFLTLHPTVYARELTKKVQQAGAEVYFVNTGWNGRGERIDLISTRKIIDAILSKSIDWSNQEKLPYFNLSIPTKIAGLDPQILNPKNSYPSPENWDNKAKQLATLFCNNFKQFSDTDLGQSLQDAGPAL